MKIKLVALFLCLSQAVLAQKNHTKEDSLTVRSIFHQALLSGQSYSNLNYLCKVIGNRLTGSPQAEEALQWGEQKVLNYGPDRVYQQSVEATRWLRGDKEWVAISEDVDLTLNACALGGSIGTDGPVQAEVIEVNGMKDIERFGPGDFKGKIVFYNEPMDRAKINTFDAYGACASQRYYGAVEAAKYGAIAVLVRSLTTLTDIKAHTGSMSYKDGVNKIPAAAISTQDADVLHAYIEDFGSAKVTMNLNCYTANENAQTYNVIAEIKGSENPEQIIVFGAHIDSWDKGEGAHDDGAGVVQCMEVIRMFKELNIRPKNTIRMALYINEENGNKGGITYADMAQKSSENHIFALESDRGGFSPRGFSIDGSDDQIAKVAQWEELLEPYGLHFFKKGYGGVDIGPLKIKEFKVNPRIMLLGLYPDSQRYFDYHHSDDDVFENVNQRELELGGASLASMIYLLDKYWARF